MPSLVSRFPCFHISGNLKTNKNQQKPGIQIAILLMYDRLRRKGNNAVEDGIIDRVDRILERWPRRDFFSKCWNVAAGRVGRTAAGKSRLVDDAMRFNVHCSTVSRALVWRLRMKCRGAWCMEMYYGRGSSPVGKVGSQLRIGRRNSVDYTRPGKKKTYRNSVSQSIKAHS